MARQSWRSRAGALPEIVEHGRTGFLVANVEEMAQAMTEVGRLDAESCREAARRRFSADTMVARYLALYHELLGGRTAVVGEQGVAPAGA